MNDFSDERLLLSNAKAKYEMNVRRIEQELSEIQERSKNVNGTTKIICDLTFVSLNEMRTRMKEDILLLELMVNLFESTNRDIDVLKQAIDGLGADTKGIKSLVEKREEIFSKIEKFAEGMAKSNQETKDKWRLHDTA